MELDDDDLELLGWGDAQTEYERPEWFQAGLIRAAQVARAVAKYQKSAHGRESRRRYETTCEAYIETHRKAALKWARANPERVKAYNKRFREKNPDYQRQYRARKKAEREAQKQDGR